MATVSQTLEQPATELIPIHHLPHPEPIRPADDAEPSLHGQLSGTAIPPELGSLTEEFLFVVICSMGQLLYAIHLGQSYVAQLSFTEALDISASNATWVIGSFLVANGVSVVLSGSLADLVEPRAMVVGAFVWLSAWNLVGAFSVTPSRKVLFFIVRAMSGLAVGTICSAAVSMLGRVYRPGQRKNRVFALMGGMIPMGFAVGALQGGELVAHLGWALGSTAILSAVCAAAASWCIPPLKADSVSWRDFDYAGAAAGVTGSGLLVFGLTQGAPTGWTPYTYALVIAGVVFLGLFGFIESRVSRPLVDNRLWKVPRFIPLMAAYFLGYGAFNGSFLFNAVRFFLTIQSKSPITAACYLITVGVSGAIAAWVVSRLLHVTSGHVIFMTSMVAFAVGPCFFLPQSPGTLFWALSFPGLAISAFGPDMSFAALSVFVTSSVPKTYQGAAGSLLMTTQNLSTAVFTALGDTIAENVAADGGSSLGLDSLRAVWWFSFAASLVGCLICALFVRIPKSEEKEHVQ